MQIKDICNITGLSARTLQYYDRIGLLKPKGHTEAGYRIYDEESIERLEQIIILKELGFSLGEIGNILDSSEYERKEALDQQIRILTLKKERLEHIISSMEIVQEKGDVMDFKAFDDAKIEEYSRRAKEKWGKTEEYAEYEKKQGKRSSAEEKEISDRFMDIFKEFGSMKDDNASYEEVMKQVEKLRNFISLNYYQCSDEILSSLADMYSAGGEFTENIDKAGGAGTAAYTASAIKEYVKK